MVGGPLTREEKEWLRDKEKPPQWRNEFLYVLAVLTLLVLVYAFATMIGPQDYSRWL